MGDAEHSKFRWGPLPPHVLYLDPDHDLILCGVGQANSHVEDPGPGVKTCVSSPSCCTPGQMETFMLPPPRAFLGNVAGAQPGSWHQFTYSLDSTGGQLM